MQPTTTRTTKCVMDELVALGEDFRGAKLLARRMEVRKCPHGRGGHGCVSVLDCFRSKSIIGKDNHHKLCIATQDPGVKRWLADIPGVPVVSVHSSVLVLDKLSEATQAAIEEQGRDKVSVSAADKSYLKRASGGGGGGGGGGGSSGGVEGDGGVETYVPKRKKRKGANPLSMKKKKTKGGGGGGSGGGSGGN